MGAQWRRWVPGPRHGLPRGVAVHGVPQSPGPECLRDHLGRCERLRDWARLRGLALDATPDDLALLDEAIDQEVREHGSQGPVAAVGNEAGLFLGTVIVATVQGAQWRLWPNAHPVVRLASGRDLDVVALANDRVGTGRPHLTRIYADAASGRPR